MEVKQEKLSLESFKKQAVTNLSASIGGQEGICYFFSISSEMHDRLSEENDCH